MSKTVSKPQTQVGKRSKVSRPRVSNLHFPFSRFRRILYKKIYVRSVRKYFVQSLKKFLTEQFQVVFNPESFNFQDLSAFLILVADVP